MPHNFGAFYRYWIEWQDTLKLPIERSFGKLLFPNLQQKWQADRTEFYLEHPICIYNAPPKATAGRQRSAWHRNAILVEGGFTLRHLDEGPRLVNGHCALTIFQMEPGPDRSLKLHELDSMHFDMELPDKQFPFHPMFHVQRDTSNKLGDKIVQETVSKVANMHAEKITVERSRAMGTQHLRLPTPQMDVFAVLTALVADFFSNSGDSDIKVKAQFKAILDLLVSPANLVREGEAARTLSDRSAGAHSCPAHWYVEHV